MSRQYLEGGCLCGAVRYRAEGEPSDVTHCHCGQCRKAAGAAFVTWFSLHPDRFHLTKGEPAIYRSSTRAERGFCAQCGSILTFRYLACDDEIDIAAATLDDPEAVTPKDHSYAATAISWSRMEDDGLPRFPGPRPADK